MKRIIFEPVTKIILGLIYLYRWCLSPLFLPSCRFMPSCSEYAIEAFSKLSLGRAIWLVTRRILSCHPWGGSGYDPVPPSCQTNKNIFGNKR